MTRRRRGHGARDALLVLALGTLAVVAALAWLALHLAVLAGCGLLIAGAYYLGQRRRARPGQVQPQRARPEASAAAAAALPVATLPLAGYEDDDDSDWEQPVTLQAGSDRDRLIAAPMSGAHPLSQLRGS
jgi:hypothetical protein